MGLKDDVLACLEQGKGAFLSGEALAQQLGVSRNAVWKAIKSLEAQGYTIEGVTKKGYRLASNCSILSAASIQRYVSSAITCVEFHSSVDSTNTRAKELAAQGCPAGTLVVADRQTAGRGRQGRPFYSPAGSGVYFSVVLRPGFPLADITAVTSFAAVCTAQAIEEVFAIPVQIKWVNDVFAKGRKCCGILTEASILPESGAIDYIVVGVGVNVSAPQGGFPNEVAQVAQVLCEGDPDAGDGRARLAARAASLLAEGAESIPDKPHLDEYRRRSLLDGRSVTVEQGRESFRALVLGINDDLTLQVQLEDGSQRALSHGEVHIPSSQL
ncbi:MAG: biotin--[acetyl-CoA-carboxylase] ligase [Coriobacteriales bacterium]